MHDEDARMTDSRPMLDCICRSTRDMVVNRLAACVGHAISTVSDQGP